MTRRQQRHQADRGIDEQIKTVQSLGTDLSQVWNVETTTTQDRKHLLRTLIEEVIVKVKREEYLAVLTLRWRGGLTASVDVSLPRSQPRGLRTNEDTIELLERLAPLYKDDVIASIFNRQGRKTATGERFTANHVSGLRNYRGIPRYQPAAEQASGELVNIRQAAKLLSVNPSTIHRLLNEGFIQGEQVTPGASWQIRLTDEVRAKFTEQTPPGFLPMIEVTQKLGVTRQTVLQRVKRGELEAVLITKGKRKGLRIKVMETVLPLLGLDS